ncbi:anthranilate phosphoribosyltransferase [Streptococcus pneumoniae]|nr:anthranilate phosphoribosyltransferase [Streptococcus pneumoniae]
MKGETPEERTAIAQVMRGHAQHIPTEIHDAMDNCGTGGDKSFSFNISTTDKFSNFASFSIISFILVSSLYNLLDKIPNRRQAVWRSNALWMVLEAINR